MIIFAQKHFTSKNAGIFSILIHLAIYFRAFIALTNRFFEKALLPAGDAALILASLTGLYYSSKNGEQMFDNLSVSVVYKQIFPLFTIVWILSLLFNGAYKQNVQIARFVRSFLIGTLVIATISYFLDEYRYSKTLLLYGSMLSLSLVLLFRAILQRLKYGYFELGVDKNKKIVIVGSFEECKRIDDLLQETNYQLNILGYITTGSKSDIKGKYLGYIKQLKNIVKLYKVEEIIFCSKDLPANSIIEWMTQIDNTVVDFKIVPEESNVIIGSNSRNRRGDFYTLNINLNIIDEKNIRNKRMLDVSASLFFLLSFPFTYWLIQHPKQFLRNTLNVLKGKYSWVGFTNTEQINLPKIRKGIINPTSYMEKAQKLNPSNISEINLSYARDYTLYMDVILIMKSFKYLGELS